MARPLFTPEELAEMAAADAEIEENFCLTNEDIRRSREMDREAANDRKDPRTRKISEAHRAYYEANRDKYNAYMRDYQRKRSLAKRQAALA